MDRTKFALRQAAMTRTWHEGVLRRGGDVEAYLGTRKTAYLDRWREAGRFLADGASVLDLGGGALYEDLLRYLNHRRFDYWYLDVDPGVVDGSRALAVSHAFDGEHFSVGFNDRLDYPDGRFDAIFSSHCLEHSYDLTSTFAEARRVLGPGGILLMAVPFGWERNPEHPYFFGPADWVALIEDAGFTVRVAQVGREYPEQGYDFFVAARRNAAAGERTRIDPQSHRKDSFTMVDAHHPSLRFDGPVEHRGEMVICRDNWAISWTAPAGTREILPVMARHAWSGIVEVAAGGARSVCDLFSWFSYVQPPRLALPAPAREPIGVRIAPVGQNTAAWAAEGVIYGLMYR